MYCNVLECAHQYNGTWLHIQCYIDQQIHEIMEGLYQKLDKKLDTLAKQISKHNSKQNTSKFQSKLINLTNIKFTKEHIQYTLVHLLVLIISES
jgi:DNA-binding ferritin-like protein